PRASMTRSRLASGIFAALVLVVGLSVPQEGLAATASGNLSALLLNEAGQPLAGVFVSLLGRSSQTELPTLTRTDGGGRIYLSDLDAGTYQLNVKSAQYRGPVSRLVEILPDRTAVVTLILQHLLAFGEDEANLGFKALLRSSESRRLIFRALPDPNGVGAGSETDRKPIQEAVVQVYSNGSLGGDYVAFPGDAASGTTTNFAAVVQSLGAGQHIVAGQLNSGQDSLWRIRNIVGYQFADDHSLQMFLGYGRLSFEQPSLSLLADPSATPEHGEFAALSGSSRLMNVGFEDNWQFGPALTFTWGLEVDQVRGGRSRSFVSPSAEVRYQATDSTAVHVAMTSKRRTVANTVTLPDGEAVTLATPVHIAQYGDETLYGTGRHWLGSVTQNLAPGSQIELAVFDNFTYGGGLPVVAVVNRGQSPSFLPVSDGMTETKGCRVSFRHSLGENLKAEVSFIKAAAPGLVSSPEELSQLQASVGQRSYHALATRWEAYIPLSKTHVTTLIQYVPDGNPLATLDAYSDIYDTGNDGVNIFVRQIIPLPQDLLKFFGLEFLAPQRVEALFDVRNLFNDDSGSLELASGPAHLVQSPRSIRGGVSFKF
ncbi:MAG: carboxypeptidase-like regulatory domain-containing protein, partial [Acidobacteriota bacterium]